MRVPRVQAELNVWLKPGGACAIGQRSRRPLYAKSNLFYMEHPTRKGQKYISQGRILTAKRFYGAEGDFYDNAEEVPEFSARKMVCVENEEFGGGTDIEACELISDECLVNVLQERRDCGSGRAATLKDTFHETPKAGLPGRLKSEAARPSGGKKRFS